MYEVKTKNDISLLNQAKIVSFYLIYKITKLQPKILNCAQIHSRQMCKRLLRYKKDIKILERNAIENGRVTCKTVYCPIFGVSLQYPP
jgi:hypothetical protein